MCEHNTSVVIYNGFETSVELCEWGCGKILVYKKMNNGNTVLVREVEYPELAALRARLAELEEIVEMARDMVSRDEIESVQSRAYEASRNITERTK